jgi:four helix bundle protein
VWSQRVHGVKPATETAGKDARVRVKGYGRKTTLGYISMLYISYGSICELETQILIAGDLGFIEKGELGTEKKDIAEIERM